jgi:hypothetical protein
VNFTPTAIAGHGWIIGVYAVSFNHPDRIKSKLCPMGATALAADPEATKNLGKSEILIEGKKNISGS